MRSLRVGITMATLSLALIGVLALGACSEAAKGNGPSDQTVTTASIRPPGWIQGYWRCRSGCNSLYPYSLVFREKEIRWGDASTSVLLFADGATQTVSGSSYTVVYPGRGTKTTYRWTRTGDGLDFDYQTTGNLEMSAKGTMERWSGRR